MIIIIIMPPRISRVTQPQVGLNCDDVADWLHANNPEMYFLLYHFVIVVMLLLVVALVMVVVVAAGIFWTIMGNMM